MKAINVDFYRVEIFQASDITLESLIQKILYKPDKNRILEIRNIPIWLIDATIEGEFIEGDFIRLGMNDIPVKGNRQGFIENIRLNNNEGLGVLSAFLYHIPTRVFLLQAGKGGISAANFARYITELTEINTTIFVDPILQIETLQKLHSMKEIRKMEIKVAGLDSLEILASNNNPVGGIRELAQYYEAPSVYLELSAGRSRNQSLSLENAKNLTNSLLRMNNTQNAPVKKLRISGDIDEDESLAIDLLRDRMREIIKHDLSSRTIQYTDRKRLIKKAWDNRAQDIFKIYPLA
jgi:hypothetical protein